LRNLDEDTITQAVLARHTDAADPRLREVMTSLVQHLHAFAREMRLTEDEWHAGIRFLTETGHITDDKRQEFVLLSDTLGLSMLVTAMNNRKPRACTEATVLGPFHVDHSPAFELGDDVANGARGEPCFVRGRVYSADGSPIPTGCTTCSTRATTSTGRAARSSQMRMVPSTSSRSGRRRIPSRTTALSDAC